MARFLPLSRRLLLIRTTPSPRLNPFPGLSSRSYMSEMRRSTLRENFLRILRTEITYETESRPPQTPAASFGSFSVNDRPGEQWIRLLRSHGGEEVQIDATMFDGAAPSKRSAAAAGELPDDADARLHISLNVEVSKGAECEYALQFVCSAWPDSLDVEKVFAVRRGHPALQPYMGPDFKELDEDMQSAVHEYLEERGVNDELADFLHRYMENKDKTELLRWLRSIEAYVKK